jgi:NAD(P)-dependent dehydrogenase (short-subunit alcohol dehydrogenase family)
MTEGLAGQVALITGGGRGIGRAVAEGLAGAGAAVAIAARTEDELAETVRVMTAAGARALAVTRMFVMPLRSAGWWWRRSAASGLSPCW